LHAHFLRDEYLNDPARFSEESAEKVIEAYKNSIAIYDKWPIPYYGLGNVWFFDLDNAEKAIPFYERALQLNPNYADAGYDLLDAYLAVDQWENAIKLITGSLSLELLRHSLQGTVENFFFQGFLVFDNLANLLLLDHFVFDLRKGKFSLKRVPSLESLVRLSLLLGY